MGLMSIPSRVEDTRTATSGAIKPEWVSWLAHLHHVPLGKMWGLCRLCNLILTVPYRDTGYDQMRYNRGNALQSTWYTGHNHCTSAPIMFNDISIHTA